MRIEVNSLDDFLENFKSAANVLGRRVYFRRHAVAINGTSNRNATSFDLYLQLTTVLIFTDESDALLACSHYCGVDRKTADDDGLAKMEYQKAKQQIELFCNAADCSLIPGLFSE